MSGCGRWLVAAALAASGVACALCCGRASPAWPLAASGGAAALLFAFGAPDGAPRRRNALVCVALFLAAFSVTAGRLERMKRTLDEASVGAPSSPSVFEFEIPADAVLRPPSSGRPAALSFRACAGGLPVSVWLPLPDGTERPAAGERWRFSGWLERYGAKPPWRRRMFWVNGRGASATRLPAPRGLLRRALDAVRTALLANASIGLENMPEAAAFNRALLFGDRSALPRASMDALSAAGTVHVFAISGLHVFVLARAVLGLFCLAGLSARPAAAAAIPAVWFYVLLAGAPPSAVRAASMATFHYGALLAWRRPDGLVSWAQTLTLFAFVSPESLAGAGCILSFAVMLALALWGRTFGAGREDAFALRLGASAAAWCAGAPVVACIFGRFAPGGLLANLAALPAAAAAFAAGAAGSVAAFFSKTAAVHLNGFAALAMDSLAGLSRTVAAIPAFSFRTDPWHPAVCIAWYAALAAPFAFHFAATRRKFALTNRKWSL